MDGRAFAHRRDSFRGSRPGGRSLVFNATPRPRSELPRVPGRTARTPHHPRNPPRGYGPPRTRPHSARSLASDRPPRRPCGLFSSSFSLRARLDLRRSHPHRASPTALQPLRQTRVKAVDHIQTTASSDFGVGFPPERIMFKLKFLQLPLFLLALSSPVTAQFAHTDHKQIVDAAGKPLLIRATNLGNWLVPEGYMWLFDDGPQSPTEIQI